MSGSGSGEESARGRKLREVLDKMFQFYEKDMLRQDAINPLVEALGEERTIELLERFLEDLRGKAHAKLDQVAKDMSLEAKLKSIEAILSRQPVLTNSGERLPPARALDPRALMTHDAVELRLAELERLQAVFDKETQEMESLEKEVKELEQSAKELASTVESKGQSIRVQ